MEEHSSQTDYRKLSSDLINSNRAYFVVGTIILGYVLYSLFYQYNDAAYAFFSRSLAGIRDKATLDSAQKVDPDLVQSLSDTNINYISPEAEKLQKAGEETGQISAIQSGKVTYHQNKYVIQPGDSLASIAEKAYGDRDAWVRIAQANNLASPDHIEVGMELVIPR